MAFQPGKTTMCIDTLNCKFLRLNNIKLQKNLQHILQK